MQIADPVIIIHFQPAGNGEIRAVFQVMIRIRGFFRRNKLDSLHAAGRCVRNDAGIVDAVGDGIPAEAVVSPDAEDFSEEILAELVAQGLSGEKLLAAFREKRAKVRSAVQTMRNDAAKAAKGEGKYATMADVFEKR